MLIPTNLIPQTHSPKLTLIRSIKNCPAAPATGNWVLWPPLPTVLRAATGFSRLGCKYTSHNCFCQPGSPLLQGHDDHHSLFGVARLFVHFFLLLRSHDPWGAGESYNGGHDGAGNPIESDAVCKLYSLLRPGGVSRRPSQPMGFSDPCGA